MNLAEKKCIACEGGTPPLTATEIAPLLAQLDAQWICVKNHHLEREFNFKNFQDALDYTVKVGAIAEAENHHPNIELGWGRVKVSIWTHKIDGLTESDFYFAAKCDQAL